MKKYKFNNKFKIIQVTPYYLPHLGGMEVFVNEISEKLTKKGYTLKVLTSNIGIKDNKIKSKTDIDIEYLKSYELAHTPIIYSLFWNLLKQSNRSTIIHLNIAQAYLPEVVWLISKIRKIPYIAHVHVDAEPTGKMGFLLPFYKKILLKRVLYSASKIVVPTKDYIAIISKKYAISKNKIVVIPSGVDLNNFKKISDKLHNPIRLLFVGRLTKQKNIPLLIQSFNKIIVNKDFNLELHIVGEGEEKNKINSMIRTLGLENRVVLHGSLSGSKLFKIYSKSDIFILSSIYESFGIVLIEAMASGLPIVASNISGVRDVVENDKTGLLVKQTPENFVSAIEKLLNNSQLRKRLIKNGLKEVKKYSWDRIILKYEHIYSEVIYENN